MAEETFTISQINNYVKGVVNAAFPQPLWICGEIQGYNRNKGKSHVFFELVEKDKHSESIVAKIGLVIFANRKALIDHTLRKSENAFDLKDDIEVRFSCKIDFYPSHGAMRLIVEGIDPTYTLGKMAQQRQKIIAALKKKGILDKNKKVKLPTVPLNIGLITSDDSAAYNDFMSELSKSGYGFKVYLKNTSMQGAKTEKGVTGAIELLQKKKDLDLIVITRGGGSIADLSDFDSQLIAEKIGACSVPVLSGIGHEINLSITDLAAHTSAKTPTAIAQFIVSCVDKFNQGLDDKKAKILESSQNIIRNEKQKLKDVSVVLHNTTNKFLKSYNQKLIELAQSIKKYPTIMLRESNRKLGDKNKELVRISQTRILNDSKKLREITNTFYKSANHKIKESKQIVNDSNQRLSRVVKVRIEKEKIKLKGYNKVVDAYHPMNTLKRGFSITRDDKGKVIRDIKQISKADKIVTHLVGGEIVSDVQHIKEENESVRE